jgi:hypothetical protein
MEEWGNLRADAILRDTQVNGNGMFLALKILCILLRELRYA